MLERKVWIDSGQRLFPNLYIILVGKAGIGKTRAIDKSTDILRQIPDFHLSPTSMTKAALVDCLTEAKRDHFITVPGGRELQCWNSLFIAVDELSAFMSKWDHELVAGLTKFYDCNFYGEARRIGKIRITIDNPQLNILCGTTPSQLLETIPPGAWSQGLMSRTILVYSNAEVKKKVLDKNRHPPLPLDLTHDLMILSGIQGGQIVWDQEYEDALNDWDAAGKPPKPKNPRLEDYCTRRQAHLIKLSMVACIDWGDQFTLTIKHFNRAMQWLLEAEANMSAIFAQGSSMDSRSHDDIIDWLREQGRPVSQHELIYRISKSFPTHMVKSALDIMHYSGRIDRDADGNWVLTP